MKEIITYDVYVDDLDELGVDKISLVRRPAILENFLYLNSDIDEVYQVTMTDDEKFIITGPALIPDLPIVRKDDDGEPYYIKYSASQIEKIVQKFFKLKDQYAINKDHKIDVSNVYMYESWLVGENDKSIELGFEVPRGTWMVSMKIDDMEIWEGIKSGKYKGFSIEGLFKFKRTSKLVKQAECTCGDDHKSVELAKIGLVHYNCRCNLTKNEFKLGSAKIGVNGEPIPCQLCLDAKLAWENQGMFTAYVGDEEWETSYFKKKTLQEGGDTSVEIVALKATDIKNNIIKLMVNTILKDGSTMYTDADAFAVGAEVYFMNGEEKVKVDAGEYELEDGNVFVVDEASVVAEIKEMAAPAEEAPVEEGVNNTEAAEGEATEAPEEAPAAAPATVEEMVAYFQPILEAIMTSLDELKATLNLNQSKVDIIETKMEKAILENEMKSVKVIDTKKDVKLSAAHKFDYDTITKLNKKF